MVEPGSREPPLGGARPWEMLAFYVQLARRQVTAYQNTVAIASVSVPKIREDLVASLVAAVAEAETLAKKGSSEAAKSVGGMSTKARWYQLLGYLAQVLDGVCRNVELSEINERLMRVEKAMKIAQSKSASSR